VIGEPGSAEPIPPPEDPEVPPRILLWARVLTAVVFAAALFLAFLTERMTESLSPYAGARFLLSVLLSLALFTALMFLTLLLPNEFRGSLSDATRGRLQNVLFVLFTGGVLAFAWAREMHGWPDPPATFSERADRWEERVVESMVSLAENPLPVPSSFRESLLWDWRMDRIRYESERKAYWLNRFMEYGAADETRPALTPPARTDAPPDGR